MANQVAQTILNQLGGNRFMAMTGAKSLVALENGLMFAIGKNDKKVNKVRINLVNDLYDIEFFNIRGVNVKVLAKVDGVYNDMLESVFTEHTGMYTRF